MKIVLLLSKYKQVIYFPYRKTLLTIWYGKITEEEHDEHIEYLNELIDIYEVKHLVIDTKKAKSHFFKPSLKFIENVLNKAIQKGMEKLTMVQKQFGNSQFVERAYQKAIGSYNLGVQVAIVEPNSVDTRIQRSSERKKNIPPAQFSSEQISSNYRHMFG